MKFCKPEILDAILEVFPLDKYAASPVVLMDLLDCDRGEVSTPIWDEYKAIVEKHDERGGECVSAIERFSFYDEAAKCYAVISTGESAIYANVIIQKGVI